jgi:A/G-specific adenine glycosylase
MNFDKKLLDWYYAHKRELPWRNTQNPYLIWLSEVILQQTRVKQGLPYYLKFAEKYPTVQNLANAPADEVLRLWQGLGYYSRARNMHKTAQIVVEKYNGIFPNTYSELITLKGIGDYTASAIASFAFQEKVAVLDGNVFRVLARVFGISEDIATPKGVKVFKELSKKLLPDTQSHIYNQAIMEFGAMQCSPQKPNCMYCPLQNDCEAFLGNLQAVLPVKTKKIKPKNRYFHYFIFEYNQEILMRKRPETDIWAGLYDFYLEEITEENFGELEQKNPFLLKNQKNITFLNASAVVKHKLTHQNIAIQFFHIEVNDLKKFQENISSEYTFYDKNDVSELPKPIMIANYLKKVKK